MSLAEVKTVYVGLLLLISGFQGQANSICAPKGSSVDLPCSSEHQTSNMKWFTVDEIMSEIAADGNHVTVNMSKENKPVLMIKDVRESDEKAYCCIEDLKGLDLCLQSRIQLSVADLQVKVIPATEGQMVTLMCSTSCTLPENPAAFIWYKNREFLYEDWSPWYQEMVSSNESVTYSCAIKGYEDVRAPEVSVDSISPTCFSVTYAKGRMCFYVQRSVDEPCSITYPRELHIQMTSDPEKRVVQLTCNTSCPLTEPRTFYSWYDDDYLENPSIWTLGLSLHNFVVTGFTCAVKGHEDLVSAESCIEDQNCWRVNYVSRRICALEGSSVSIFGEYLHPEHKEPEYKCWYRMKKSRVEAAEKLTETAGRVEFQDNVKNQHILKIQNLKKSDSAEYRFRLQKNDQQWRMSNLPGVMLIITALKVKFTPSTVVTEGQKVTLTCSTSCPLTHDPNYIWYQNRRPLTLPEHQNKHLVLDPLSKQHAGNYSCAVATQRDIRSSEKMLPLSLGTSIGKTGTWIPAAAGVSAALLVVLLVAAALWIRQKRSSRSPGTETSQNTEQLNPGPVYENASAQLTEQDDLYYSKVQFQKKHAEPLYSTVQPHPPQVQEDEQYSIVHFKADSALE